MDLNWEAVGAIAELLGAIGVVVTLVYLTSQIRQNTKALYRNEMNTALDQWSSFRKLLLSNPSFGEVLGRGSNDIESLSTEDRATYDLLMEELMNIFRHTFHRSKEGVVGSDEWERNTKPRLAEMLNQPGAKQWWNENMHTYPEDFLVELSGA